MTRYLKNAWYLAAWADECSNGTVLVRTLLDIPIAIFRDSDNAVHALHDRCPHRFAPLSMGGLEGNALVCGYHGLAFGGDGQCSHNPHGPVTRAMKTRSFPMREAHRGLWIWMGDPKLACDATLPDLSFVDRTPDTAFSKGYVVGNGHYQLFTDNILDLTHADYLHPDTLGGGAFTRTRAKVTELEHSVKVEWHAFNETPSPLSAGMRGSEAPVDSWTEVEWHAPGIMTLKSGAVLAGTSRSAGGNVLNLHIMTPETSRSTHYFYASTRDFAMDDADLNQNFAAARDHIFSTEDKPMIDAQQSRMGDSDFWNLEPVLLRIDEGAVRVRRRLDAMIAAETGEPS